MLMLILLTIVLVALFYYFIVKPFHYWTERGVKQGNPKWIVGDNWGTISKKQNMAELVEMAYTQFPDARYSGMYQFYIPTLVIREPDLIKQITIKDFEHFTDHRSFIPEEAEPLWAKNLFSLKGHKWRDMRVILSPSFTASRMRHMLTLMAECAENFVQHFLNKNEDVITLEFKDAFTRFTNDVIATTAFGVKVDSLGQPNNKFYLMGKDVTDFSGLRKKLKFFASFLVPKLFNFFKITIFSKEASNFFCSVVSDTIKMREEKGIVRPDMINLLLEARKGVQGEENGIGDNGSSTAQGKDFGKTKTPKEISNLDIAAQAMIFFFAGFDGVSALMCFMAYELAVNQDVQNRLRQEIISMEGRSSEILKMKYMDMVVSETLRKWPFGVTMDRVCTKPYTIDPVNSDEKPVHLKKGDVLWIPVFGIHRDPKHFPDPERFDPERFSDDNKDNIKPYTYFPFGLGPRNCIGSRFALLETKAIFFYLLQSFEIVPVEKSQIPLRLSRKQLNLTAEGGFWFGLKRINK